ncbi:hypothetical protein CW304_10585 [Bacillus sp. UFRGS-B20]|nr:hypothetical protein CW304_10585 [Bacillus sp. UFRGS-B20]
MSDNWLVIIEHLFSLHNWSSCLSCEHFILKCAHSVQPLISSFNARPLHYWFFLSKFIFHDFLINFNQHI